MKELFALEQTDLKWISEFGSDSDVLWKCEKTTFLPLPGLWGMIGSSPLMVLRQFGITQFIPATDFFKDDSFSYEDANSKEKIAELINAWNSLDYMINEGNESTESIVNYKHWASERVRDVVALQNWVTDPEHFPPPVREKTRIENYKELLSEKTPKV